MELAQDLTVSNVQNSLLKSLVVLGSVYRYARFYISCQKKYTKWALGVRECGRQVEENSQR
jgi:hypothetical protein